MKKTGSFFIFFIINPAYFSRKCNKFETDDNSAYFQRIILKKFAGDRFSECQNRTIRAFFAYNPGLATGVPRMIIFPIFAPQESPFFPMQRKILLLLLTLFVCAMSVASPSGGGGLVTVSGIVLKKKNK